MKRERVELPRGVICAGGILDTIVQARVIRVEEAKRARPLEILVALVASSADASGPGEARALREALRREGRVNIIAEVKRRSPSKGIIREEFDHISIARSYEDAGAAAVSVLTEEEFFGGSLDFLRDIRKVVRIPLLRKDFIFDEYQVYEAAEAGAAAILLIAAILGDRLLTELMSRADELGLDALVEVHTEEEMRRVAQTEARIIGVNNRDLKTFEVDLSTSLKLAPLAPATAILVSESGIDSGKAIDRLKSAGYSGVLVGERLMREPDPGASLRSLFSEAMSPDRAFGEL